VDYFEEGQKVLKNKDMIGTGFQAQHNFEKYVYDFVFKNASEYDKGKFVSGLLTKTKNEMAYIRATGIANRVEKNVPIWETILYNFSLLIKGKRKPKWAFGFVSGMLQSTKFNISNYMVERVVWVILNYDDQASAWWIDQIKDKDYFKEHKKHFEMAVLKYAKDFEINRSKMLFDIFKSTYFYNNMVEKNPKPIALEAMLQSMNKYRRDLEGFVGGFEVDGILKNDKFTKLFEASANSMNYITSLIKDYHTPETGQLFVDLLGVTGFTEESQTLWLMKIKDINDSSVNAKLYELTGNDEYLSQEARDLFLF
jgi:hypothetical protein